MPRVLERRANGFDDASAAPAAAPVFAAPAEESSVRPRAHLKLFVLHCAMRGFVVVSCRVHVHFIDGRQLRISGNDELSSEDRRTLAADLGMTARLPWSDEISRICVFYLLESSVKSIKSSRMKANLDSSDDACLCVRIDLLYQFEQDELALAEVTAPVNQSITQSIQSSSSDVALKLKRSVGTHYKDLQAIDLQPLTCCPSTAAILE